MNPALLPLARPARVEDEAAVVALMRDFYAEERLVFDETATPRAARELLANPGAGAVLLLEHADAVAGYLALTFGFSLEFGGCFALLDELYLKPSARGRGWGRHAIDLAATAARERGAGSLRLEVNHGNARAKSLYLKNGFADDRRDLLTRRLR